MKDETNAAPAAHPFDRAIAMRLLPDGNFLARTSDDYPNHIGFFGGYVAAVALNAALSRPDRLGDPVALTVNFAGPLVPGEFSIDIEPLRTTKSTQHWSIRLVQGPEREVKVSALAVFGLRREVWDHTASRPPQAPPAAECAAVPARFSGWFRNYEVRVPGGEEPAGTGELSSWQWIAEKPARALDFCALAAMCDSFYPRLYLKRPERSGVVTVSMNIYFHVDARILSTNGSRPVLAQADSQVFAGGFYDQHGLIWSDAGTLLASTHHIVYYR